MEEGTRNHFLFLVPLGFYGGGNSRIGEFMHDIFMMIPPEGKELR